MRILILLSCAMIAGCGSDEKSEDSGDTTTTDTGTTGTTGTTTTDTGTTGTSTATPAGCGIADVMCVSFTDVGWAAIGEEDMCTEIAAKRMQPFAFLADGCPEGALAVCDMPDAMGAGTYTSLTTWYYAGMDVTDAEAGCLAQDGTFSMI